MNSKWVLVTGVVALIAIVAIVLAIFAQSSSSSKTAELATGDARLVKASQTVSALDDAQSTSVAQLATADVEASRTVSALNDAQSTSEAQLVMATQTISALVDAQSTSNAQLVAAEIRIERAATSVAISSAHQTTLSSRLYEQTRRVLALEATTRCDRTPTTIDYSSQSGVSNSLKTWLEETIGTIDDAEWDIVWGNSKTAIHYLRGEFMYVYIVFFDDPDLYHTNSIFDVSNGCWLELPEFDIE